LWWVLSIFVDLASRVLSHVGSPAGRPAVVAIDGRSASGKTTLAARLAAAVPRTAVVHTDDIAWHHSVFDWVDLLVSGVLGPVRQGLAVSYRPPAWDARGRPGSVSVPTGCRLLVVEGVGAGRRELAPFMDGIIWVETESSVTRRRDAARIEAGETTQADYDSWMAEEEPFVASQQTWERAFVIVDGTASLSDA
jgi:energy-coupling factor transporter ATP-binding protein EcfA2